MPSHSAKQERAMRAAAHDPETRRKMGIDKETAEEFANADKRKRDHKEGETAKATDPEFQHLLKARP